MRGRPKQYLPPSNAFAQVRKGEELGHGIRDFIFQSKKGKKITITAGRIINAMNRGEMIDIKGAKIDPTKLHLHPKLPNGVSLDMSESTIGKLRSRKFISEMQYNAGLWFRNLYRRAYGVPEPSSLNWEGVSGGKPTSPLDDLKKRSEAYMKFVEKMREKGEYTKLGPLITYVACDYDPQWLDGKKIPVGDLFIPEGDTHHKDITSALDAVVQVLGWRE